MARKPSIKIDLHSHTTCSDGALSPVELVREAARRGITHLAVSDHDTTSGIEPARVEAANHNITIIPAIELTCRVRRKERFTTVHILGIGVEHEAASLKDYVARVESSRRGRYWAMIGKLRDECGLKISDEDFTPAAGVATLGRPQIARRLAELGHCKRMQQAFDYWIGGGKPAYVPHDVPDASEAIAAIAGANGISVVAHPGKYRDGLELAEELLVQGLRGVEVHHPDHSEPTRAALKNMATRHNAFMSGGADFHEHGSPNARFFGECLCEPAEFERMNLAPRQA